MKGMKSTKIDDITKIIRQLKTMKPQMRWSRLLQDLLKLYMAKSHMKIYPINIRCSAPFCTYNLCSNMWKAILIVILIFYAVSPFCFRYECIKLSLSSFFSNAWLEAPPSRKMICIRTLCVLCSILLISLLIHFIWKMVIQDCKVCSDILRSQTH